MARDEKNKRPYILLYINDFLSSPFVQAMNDSQHRWYLTLLFRAWQSSDPCHLENDDELLRINAGCKSKPKWNKHKHLVLKSFQHDETKNTLTHWRLLDQYEEMMESSERKRLAGIASAAARQQPSTAVEQPSTLQIQPQIHIQKEQEQKKAAPLALPDWLPSVQWQAFLEMRKKKRVANTDYALKLVIGKIEEYRNKGHPPEKVLDLAIERGWTTVWEPKESVNGQQSKNVQRADKNDEILDRYFEKPLKGNS